MLNGNLCSRNLRYRLWMRGQRSGALAMAAIAASNSFRNSSAAAMLRSAYHGCADLASSSARGWSLTAVSATRQTLTHYIPGNALHSAGLELRGTALDLHSPRFFDARLDLGIQAVYKRAN